MAHCIWRMDHIVFLHDSLISYDTYGPYDMVVKRYATYDMPHIEWLISFKSK